MPSQIPPAFQLLLLKYEGVIGEYHFGRFVPLFCIIRPFRIVCISVVFTVVCGTYRTEFRARDILPDLPPIRNGVCD